MFPCSFVVSQPLLFRFVSTETPFQILTKRHLNNAIVIIPTYNEKENITLIIDTVFSLPKDFDILIVDDNSPDGTAEMVKDLQKNYNNENITRLHLLQRPGKAGLGTAYIEGFRYSMQHHYDFVLQMDADFSHNPKDLVNLYLTCAEWGNDLAIGSRYATGVNVVN